MPAARSDARAAIAAAFLTRARHYELLHGKLRESTSFFLAAAWINRLLWMTCRRRILGGAGLALLHSLGDHLQTENVRMAGCIERGTIRLPPAELDRTLVWHEQRMVDRHLASRRRDWSYRDACRQLDGLLNSPMTRWVQSWMSAPLAAMAQLSAREPLSFDNTAHREAIGHAILSSLRGGVPRKPR